MKGDPEMVKSDYEERWGYVKGHMHHERDWGMLHSLLEVTVCGRDGEEKSNKAYFVLKIPQYIFHAN